MPECEARKIRTACRSGHTARQMSRLVVTMPEPITLTPRPSELACECGSVWFTTEVQFDARTGALVSHSVTRARCSRCGVAADVEVGGQ